MAHCVCALMSRLPLTKDKMTFMLALQGKLDISVNGIPARLEADGGAVLLDLDEPVRFLIASRLFHKNSLTLLRLLAGQLAQNGLTLTIVSRKKILAVMGQDIKGGMAGLLLGMPHFEVRGAGLLGRVTI